MDISKLMAQAQKMQSEMKKKQEELEKTIFESSVAGGACHAKMYGDYHMDSISFDKSLIDVNDTEMVSDMLVAAVNSCADQIKAATEKIAGDMQSSLKGF